MSDRTPMNIFPRIFFPVELLPLEYRELIDQVADSCSVPVEAVATATLTLLSSAIGNSIKVSVKEDWAEPVFLWSMLCGHTGCGKTPFVNKLLEPIRQKEAESYLKLKDALQLYETEKILYDSKKRNKKIDLCSDRPPIPPQMEHIYITDATLEALANAMATSPRGLLLFHDELSGLIKGCDQYKGSGNDRQKYLELWSCKPWKIHRVTKPSVHIQSTGCAILGGIQPLVLPEIFKRNSFLDGLIMRFLICDISDHEHFFNPVVISQEQMRFWFEEIDRCYALQITVDSYGRVIPQQIRFDEEALEEFKEFNDAYKRREFWLPDHAKGFVPKLISYCVRIAGLLAVMHEEYQSIDVHILRKAIKITNYYAGQAMHMLGYYDPKYKPLPQFESDCCKTLLVVAHSKMKYGKIPLSALTQSVNLNLPDYKKRSAEEVAAVIHKLGLRTKLVGGYSQILWTEEAAKNISQRITSTTSTEGR